MNIKANKLKDLTLTIRGEGDDIAPAGASTRDHAHRRVADLLRHLANRIETGDTNPQTDELDRMNIMDVNGNSIGLCELLWEVGSRPPHLGDINYHNYHRDKLAERWNDTIDDLETPEGLEVTDDNLSMDSFVLYVIDKSGERLKTDEGYRLQYGVQFPDYGMRISGEELLTDYEIEDINNWLSKIDPDRWDDVASVEFSFEFSVECICEHHSFTASGCYEMEVDH